jgi:hypothetical protein
MFFFGDADKTDALQRGLRLIFINLTFFVVSGWFILGTLIKRMLCNADQD